VASPVSLPLEPGHDLHVGGVPELIDWRHRREPIAGTDQNCGIAREGRGIARYRDDQRHAACRERARLRIGSLPRRIEHDGIVGFELVGEQRAAE